jgi:protein subunit release factor B
MQGRIAETGGYREIVPSKRFSTIDESASRHTRDKMIALPVSDADLLVECDVETFRSSGKGGQNVNKVETAVRLRHRPSGLTVVAREARSQYRNKQICLARLRALAARLNRVKPKRIATSIPASVRADRLLQKHRRSEKKRLRRTRKDVGDD